MIGKSTSGDRRKCDDNRARRKKLTRLVRRMTSTLQKKECTLASGDRCSLQSFSLLSASLDHFFLVVVSRPDSGDCHVRAGGCTQHHLLHAHFSVAQFVCAHPHIFMRVTYTHGSSVCTHTSLLAQLKDYTFPIVLPGQLPGHSRKLRPTSHCTLCDFIRVRCDKKRCFVETILVVIHLTDLLSVSIQKRKNTYSFCAFLPCVYSRTVYTESTK